MSSMHITRNLQLVRIGGMSTLGTEKAVGMHRISVTFGAACVHYCISGISCMIHGDYWLSLSSKSWFNSLGKPIFPCERVDARWGKLDCEQRLCDLQGSTAFGDDIQWHMASCHSLVLPSPNLNLWTGHPSDDLFYDNWSNLNVWT